MKNFLLPSFLLDGSITSDKYPKTKPEIAIAILPIAFPIPLNSAGISNISLYAQKVNTVTTFRRSEVPNLQIP